MVKKGLELRGLITENEGEEVEGGLKREVALEMVSFEELWLIAAAAMDIVEQGRLKRCRFKNGKRGLR